MARSTRAVKMPACSATGLSLAMVMASSMRSYAAMPMTGPKTSSVITLVNGATPSSTVGATMAGPPASSPPQSTRAPTSVASATHCRMRSALAWSITGPTSVPSSSGSPTERDSTSGSSACTKASCTSRCVYTRCTEMHDCPPCVKALAATFAAARPTSASRCTMTGVALPRSSATGISARCALMAHPTGPLPVNEIMRMRGSATSAWPTSPSPSTVQSMLRGSPASHRMAASARPDSGVRPAGFSTTGAPAATAGPSLCATRLRGKLNGVMAAITPWGSRTVNPKRPAPASLASMGTTSPVIVRATAAENASVSTHRATSPRACVMGLPASAAMMCASTSARSRTSADARSRMRARSAAEGA